MMRQPGRQRRLCLFRTAHPAQQEAAGQKSLRLFGKAFAQLRRHLDSTLRLTRTLGQGQRLQQRPTLAGQPRLRLNQQITRRIRIAKQRQHAKANAVATGVARKPLAHPTRMPRSDLECTLPLRQPGCINQRPSLVREHYPRLTQHPSRALWIAEPLQGQCTDAESWNQRRPDHAQGGRQPQHLRHVVIRARTQQRTKLLCNACGL
jgi:hypothetical protein